MRYVISLTVYKPYLSRDKLLLQTLSGKACGVLESYLVVIVRYECTGYWTATTFRCTGKYS